jgi:DnaJ-class molecular chaperone
MTVHNKKANPLKPEQTPGLGNPAPGDEAPAGALGTGENLCADCHGGGRIGEKPCPICGGTGKIIESIGG